MKYDVYGIGNAIVDIVTQVEGDFFEKNGVEKGVMTLVDESRQDELMKHIDLDKSMLIGGGSASNTVTAISQFGGKCFYSCVVAQDDIGKFFLKDLAENKVETNSKLETSPIGKSGRCLVMTSPEGQRTMNTFLGVSSSFSSEHLDINAVKNSSYVFLEGYLVATPRGLEGLKLMKRTAQKNDVKVALTFSDPSMVLYFPQQMSEVVGTGVDLLFCNEEEAKIYTKSENLHEARRKLKELAHKFVITLGANGALIYDGDTFIQIEPFKVPLVDTNGAGDMFSGAFLYGITNHHSYAEAGKLASLASSKVVSQRGARLSQEQANETLEILIPE